MQLLSFNGNKDMYNNIFIFIKRFKYKLILLLILMFDTFELQALIGPEINKKNIKNNNIISTISIIF